MSSAHHIQQAEHALSLVKRLASTESGWKLLLRHQSGVHVSVTGDKSPIYRGELVIEDFSPQAIFYVIGNRKLWDEWYDDGNLIENLNDTTSLTYEVMKSSKGSWLKDMVLVEKIECTSEGIIIFAATSVDTPKVPRINGRRRTKARLLGWLLEPLATFPVSTRVTHYVQFESKPWKPSFAMRKSMIKKPLVLDTINQYLQIKGGRFRASTQLQAQREREKERDQSQSQQPQQQPPQQQQQTQQQQQPSSSLKKAHALTLPPSRSRGTSFSSNASRPHQQARLLSTAASINTASDRHAAMGEEPVHGGRILKRSQGSRRSLGGGHKCSKALLRAMESLKILEAQTEGWESLALGESHPATTAHVQAYALRQPGTAPTIRAEGVISGEWSPEQACAVIQNLGARRIWDERFEAGEVVERFNQLEMLVYYQLKGIPPLGGRDISAATAQETNPETGVTRIVTVSVEDSKLPEDPHRIRAHMFSGWIIRPETDPNTERIQAIHVTYISRLDLRGSPPPSVLRTLMLEVPECIVRVGDFLERYGPPPYLRKVAGRVVDEACDLRKLTYDLTYVARQPPTKGFPGWYTELRVGQKLYPTGFDVAVQPDVGLRVELAPDIGGVRIHAVHESLDGQEVAVRISRNMGSGIEMTVNGQPVVFKPQAKIPAAIAASTSPDSDLTPSTKGVEDPVGLHPSLSVSAEKYGMEAKRLDEIEEEEIRSDFANLSLAGTTDLDMSGLAPRDQTSEACAKEGVYKNGKTLGVGAENGMGKVEKRLRHFSSQTVVASEDDDDVKYVQPAGAKPVYPSGKSRPRHRSSPPLNMTGRANNKDCDMSEGLRLDPGKQKLNHVLIISDELSFNSQQLALVFMGMLVCYYVGKFSCLP
ncbi:uncharacterized protein VTP21DRAFT_6556 [Calcarisporiella thermophila]|uniref:uncharacterized protein n=1 Tax=Calcarisporiella thermophila TaxID=911321 RepID=UPI003742A30C